MLSALYMAVRNEQKRVRGYVSYPLTRFLSIRPAIDAWGRGAKSAIRKADTAPRSQAKLVSSGFLECGSQSAGQGLHGIQTGAHHPRAQCFGPPFRSRSGRRCRRRCPAGLTHPAGPSGPGPTPPQAALDLQLGFGWVCFVAQTQVFRVVPALGPATPVDGLVGVLDDVWNLSMTFAALGKCSQMPLANSRLMSHVTRPTRFGSPLRSMKSCTNRSTVCASLPGTTRTMLRSAWSATTVMQLRPLRPVPSMPIACTPV